MDRFSVARTAILDDLKRRFRQGDKSVIPCKDTHRWHVPQDNYFAGCGQVECPNCGGKLDYVRSAYNGHVTARCFTAGCVSWME